MKFYNICSKKTFKKNEQDKTVWLNIGTLRVNDDGKIFLELNMFLGVPFYVFEQTRKEDRPAQSPVNHETEEAHF